MNRFLKRKIHTIFIMLGNSCNLSCAYCLQHPLVDRALPGKINPEIFDFIEEAAKEAAPNLIHIQFYGGEPLIYFEDIKKIVAEMERRKVSLSYGVISNGKAITDEMVAFFNTRDIPVTISWDGPHTVKTRGFDVFAVPELKARLLELNRLGLSAVISAAAYPVEVLEAFQRVSDEYEKIHGYQVYVNLDEIFDTGLSNRWLLKPDYLRIQHDMHTLAVMYLTNFGRSPEKKDYTKMVFMNSLFGTLKSFYVDGNGEWKRYTVACGNGLTTLNMDLNGNLYPCHNTSRKAGDIHTPFFVYLQEILAGDDTKLYRKKCLECPALAFCKGGCKLVSRKARRETYCKMKQAMFGPVIRAFEEYGLKAGGADGEERDHSADNLH